MCMTRLFICFYSLFFCYWAFSQENINLKISHNVDSVMLSDLSYIGNSTLCFYEDTSVFIPTDYNNLFHLKNKIIDYYIFLNDNSTLQVEIEDDYAVFVSGENEFFIQFLNQYYQNYQPKFNRNSSLFFNTNIDHFEIQLYNFINQEIGSFYEKHILKDKFNAECKNYFQKLIHYEYLSALSYFILKQNQGIVINEHVKTPISKEINLDWLTFDDLENSLRDINFYDLHIFQQYIFQTKLLFSLDQYDYPLKDIEDFQSFSIHFFNFVKHDVSSDLLVFCFHNYVSQYGSFLQTKTFDYLINILKSEKINSIKIQEIEKIYKNISKEDIIEEEKHTKDKNIKHDFYMEDVNGNQAYLSDYEGFVLYVDIWASWCGPCRRQFPYVKELKQKLSRKQLKKIKFIYISIDNDYDKWRNSMSQLDIKNQGEHFISPASNFNGAGSYFEAASIPRYILIDRNGDISDNNAKRPSDDSILNDLIDLLNK